MSSELGWVSDDARLLALVESIYRTGSERHDWDALLAELSGFVGASAGMLGISDIADGQSDPTFRVHELDENFLAERWLGEFDAHDPWAAQGYAPAEGEVVTGAQLLAPDEFRKMPIYSGLYEQLRIEDCLVTSLMTTGSRIMFLSLYHERAHGYFGRQEVHRLGLLTPHLVRAAHLEMTLAKSRLLERANRAALDEVGYAVFSVRRLEVEALNRSGEELLRIGDGLQSRSGRLHATDPSSNEALHANLVAAGGGHAIPNPAIATPFPLHRGLDRLSLTCWTVPVAASSPTALATVAEPGCALLLVGDPELRTEVATETVARLFGLTPAESRLAAAIASDETLREYAERRELSENTVRWTLKQIQSKLGARRQLEIASLLLRSVPSLRAAE